MLRCVDWIHLAQVMVPSLVLGMTIMNPQVSRKTEIFFTRQATISFSRRNVHYGVEVRHAGEMALYLVGLEHKTYTESKLFYPTRGYKLKHGIKIRPHDKACTSRAVAARILLTSHYALLVHTHTHTLSSKRMSMNVKSPE